MMMIGQRLEEDEKEKRQRKSQIYREMLDHQVMMNQNIRKDRSTSKDKEYQSYGEYIPSHLSASKHSEHIDSSFVKEIYARPSRKEKSSFLPSLKDKNTHFRGSSRFLKVQEPVRLPRDREKRHVFTQQIQEQDESYDGYNSTCEQIIKELQNISSKPVKFRNKRKLPDRNDLLANRRFGQKNNQRYNQKNNVATDKVQVHWQDRQIYPTHIRANKQPFKEHQNPQSRYSQFSSVHERVQQRQYNQFDSLEPVEFKKHNKVHSLLGTQNQSQSLDVNRRSPAYQSSLGQKDTGRNGEEKNNRNVIPAELHKQNKTKTLEQTPNSYQSTQQKATKRGNDRKNKGNETITNHLPLSRNKMQTEPSEDPIQKSPASRQGQQEMDSHRQTFVQLLRKVKNRGESLYLKLAKFPPEKSSQPL